MDDKAVRKAAKRAAKEAAAAVAEEDVEGFDPLEAKRARKAAKRAAAVAAEETAAAAAADEAATGSKKQKKKKDIEGVEEADAGEPAKKKKKKLQEVEEEVTGEAPTNKRKKKKAQDVDEEEQEAAPKNGREDKNNDAADDGNYKVFVGGIPWSCDEDTLKKDFMECGEVVDCKIAVDKETGKSRGFAFITFNDKAGLDAALKFDGDDYGGRHLKVVKADGSNTRDGNKGKGKGKTLGPKPDGCTSVVVKGLSYSVTDEDLMDVFKKCGTGPSGVKVLMNRETGASRGMAFVDFEDGAAVDEAMKLTGTSLKGRSFFIDYAKPREW
eukprot:gnl/TRDRNA2_/TRDRNA2_83417_c0_seq1.p1 gnl/TRDRNA2_/TRDRNA2_83417_c0~~gnl/TRDRNA2_/TRDRNA2_83417_c0_seq1.p1  ORF type:complete len:351 (+),score=109.18 gnl/TRDRNA2_/TRDRNA2_83417_c0_seq1:77-1054(+)